MARIRFEVFAGEIPKVASHLLGDQNAQESLNAKIDSGMLESWYQADKVENTEVANPKTLYQYMQNEGATKDWWVSDEDLDFVGNPQSVDLFERVFFAGALNDTFFADFVLVGGSAVDAETVAGYDASLGKITLTTNFADLDFAVDDYVLYSGTLYKITSLDLTEGAGDDWVIIENPPAIMTGTIGIQEKLFDSPNYGTKELRFFANDLDGVEDWNGDIHYGVLGLTPPDGVPVAEVAGVGSEIDEGAALELSWIYTYVNQYGEESVPSDPSTIAAYDTSVATGGNLNLYFKPPFGVGSNEAVMPADFFYGVTQIKLYRSSTGVETSDFLFSKTLNLSSIVNIIANDTGVDGYVPATGVITLTSDFAPGDIDPAKWHYVLDNDNGRYYRITAVSLAGGAGADTITIGDSKPNTLSSDIDILEWTTIDDTATADLGDPIETETYFSPPADLDGLTSMASGHLYGWKNNTLYYSIPYLPYAWNPLDVISIDQNIVVARGFANTLCIATDGNPYVFSGQTPRTFNKIKMGKWTPCLSKRATVKLDNSILFPAREGLMDLSPNGVINTTAKLIRRETWVGYTMANAFALYRNDRYYAFPNNAAIKGFIIDYNDKQFLTLNVGAECGYLTPDDGLMFYVDVDSSEGAGTTLRSIKQWQGDQLNFLPFTWKSKKVILPRDVNMSVARIELDDDFYENLLGLIAENEYLQEQNSLLFAEQTYEADVAYDSYVSGTGVITMTDAHATGSITTNMRVQDQGTGYCYPIASVDLGNGAGADLITLDTVSGSGGEDCPPATLTDPFDIIIPRDLQGALNSGDLNNDLTGRTLNRHTINGDILFDLNDVTASPYVILKIWANGILVFTKSVDTYKAFKLPKGMKAKRWEIQLSGSIPVRRFDMATTMKELITS